MLTAHKIDCPKDFMQCYKCDKFCSMKELFYHPNDEFYYELNETGNAYGGFLLMKGLSIKEAEEQVKILKITIITSRMQYFQEVYKSSV